MNNYLVFTDECGSYINDHISERFIKAHPFYIRSYVIMDMNDYRSYQNDITTLNKAYSIPINEEIKWSDLWLNYKGKPRNSIIGGIAAIKLKGYYRKVFEKAVSKKSFKLIFTVTFNYDGSCKISPDSVYRMHLQDAFQRVTMEIDVSDFAVFIMDEINEKTLKNIKAACHGLIINGDFLEYRNIYQGILVEDSVCSPGIQLADYVVGAFNGYLRGQLLDRGKYLFATDLYNGFIKPNIRKSKNEGIVGYGVMDVPGRYKVRSKLEKIL